MKLAMTYDGDYQLHGIACLSLLKRRGFDVDLCLNVTTVNWRRIAHHLRNGRGTHLVRVARRLLRQRSAKGVHPGVQWMQTFNRDYDLPSFRDIRHACRALDVRRLDVASLSSDAAVSALTDVQPDVLIYAGGGILRRKVLDVPTIGTLNAHGGPLPHFRGMCASEWAILHGVEPGVTVHFVDTGIDTGPILFFQPLSVSPSDTLFDLRGKLNVLWITALLKGVESIHSGDYSPTEQRRRDGRQFFRMEPALQRIVEQRIASQRLAPYEEHYEFPSTPLFWDSGRDERHAAIERPRRRMSA
ncbi:MAG: formyltransferase family protein [Candidatus Poribacteria bacterium]|nr:formyltransferase family protein [Candidatus Poribacteria bacterium]